MIHSLQTVVPSPFHKKLLPFPQFLCLYSLKHTNFECYTTGMPHSNMPHKIEVTRAPALNSSLNFSFKGLQAAGIEFDSNQRNSMRFNR